MCGILCHVRRKLDDQPSCSSSSSSSSRAVPWDALARVNDARGPDACREETIRTTGKTETRIRGSVLALRGQKVVEQPLYSTDGRLLMLWNGEVFDSLTPLDPTVNDGVQLLSLIGHALERDKSIEEAANSVLSGIEGPYAFVLYDTRTDTLLYGRDPLGRRSLLQQSTGTSDFLLCSAAAGKRSEGDTDGFTEVDCSCLWALKVDGCLEVGPSRLPRVDTIYTRPFRLFELQPSQNRTLDSSHEVATSILLQILSDSVRRRVTNIRLRGSSSEEAQVAVLFSGGLDCTTLALLAHQHLPTEQPIDLLNVAFENPRVLQAKAKSNGGLRSEATGSSSKAQFDVPDRLTGRQSCQELQRVAPDRKWNFIEVNVSHAEYLQQRSTVESLMEPCSSVMDLSIASALYFACRGETAAKVLLSGLGADELLGGYSRHRKAFAAGAKQSLVEELQMDLDRLATRNLGRDDRILSSSGKEARYPFLSQSVISHLSNLPVECKMDFTTLPAGQGDKMLLRRAAHQLGLTSTSTLVKRAIQFGARSAKMELGQGKVLGHEPLRA